MNLRSQQKRSYSLGHVTNKELSESANQGRRSILADNKSSRSVSSLKKKRISWGPSKVLEFFPSEHFIDRESQDLSEHKRGR